MAMKKKMTSTRSAVKPLKRSKPTGTVKATKVTATKRKKRGAPRMGQVKKY